MALFTPHITREIKRLQAPVFMVAIIIGMPLLLALSSTHVLVENIDPDELGSMGVFRRP